MDRSYDTCVQNDAGLSVASDLTDVCSTLGYPKGLFGDDRFVWRCTVDCLSWQAARSILSNWVNVTWHIGLSMIKARRQLSTTIAIAFMGSGLRRATCAGVLSSPILWDIPLCMKTSPLPFPLQSQNAWAIIPSACMCVFIEGVLS